MFTERELKLFYGVLKISCSCFIIPYTLSFPNTTLKLYFSSAKTVFSQINLGLCIIYTMFNTVRLLQMCIWFGESKAVFSIQIEDLVLGAFFLLVRFVHLVSQITIVLSTPELAQLLNRQIVLNSNMGK